jgi:hypothetical protein
LKGKLRHVLLLFLLALPGGGFAQTSSDDGWIPAAAQASQPASPSQINSNLFATLHAEVLLGKLRILWPGDVLSSSATVVVQASAGELGHWPARDWHSYPMTKRGEEWQTNIPVEDLDVSLVYFAQLVNGVGTNVSPLRCVTPRAAGLEEPTRLFWPFMEGFEEGIEGWKLLSASEGKESLKADSSSKNGRVALSVGVLPGKRSATVATTRLRGWQLKREQATGVRIWLRAREGKGRARFTIFANAFMPNQIVRAWPKDTQLDERWRKVELLFSELPDLPLGAVDLFAIEFIGDGPRDFLLDDLQLLGRWKLVPE